MLDYLRLACRCQNQTQGFLCWKKTHSNQVKHKSKYLKFSCNICFLSPYTNSELPWLRANCQCCHWQLLVRHPAMHCNHWNPLFWHQRRVIQVGDSGHPDFRTWFSGGKKIEVKIPSPNFKMAFFLKGFQMNQKRLESGRPSFSWNHSYSLQFPRFFPCDLFQGDSKLRDRVTGVAIATAVYFAASALIQAPTWETRRLDVCWRPILGRM